MAALAMVASRAMHTLACEVASSYDDLLLANALSEFLMRQYSRTFHEEALADLDLCMHAKPVSLHGQGNREGSTVMSLTQNRTSSPSSESSMKHHLLIFERQPTSVLTHAR